MANEFGNITYGDTSRREDLTNLIANISPTDTPFSSGLKFSEKVMNTFHEWQTDLLASRGSNAFPEGHLATYTLSTNPTRLFNVTQILRKDGSVSKTNEAVNHAGMKGQVAYQQGKLAKEFKNDLEFASINSTLNTGASGVARQMKGALALIQTVVSALSSLTLSETIFNDFLQLVETEGGSIDETYVGFWLKRKISGFTANSTKFAKMEDKRLVNTISVYEGDFGITKIFKSRELNSTGASTATMFGIDSEHWSAGWLRPPQMFTVPPDGSDAFKFYMIGEITLRMGADGANFEATGIHNSL